MINPEDLNLNREYVFTAPGTVNAAPAADVNGDYAPPKDPWYKRYAREMLERSGGAMDGMQSSVPASQSASVDAYRSLGKGIRNLAGKILGFADGGAVQGPTLALIGEGGEREYVLPESKVLPFARKAMATGVAPNPAEIEREEPGEELEPEDQPVTHKFSSTQFNLPDELKEAVLALAAEISDEDLGEEGRESEPHITIRYGVRGTDPEEVAAALKGVAPVKATLGETSLFPPSEHSKGAEVLKLDVDGPGLAELNQRISECVDCEPSSFKEYKPHVTLGYVKAGSGKKYAGNKSLAGKEVIVDRVVFSSKDGSKKEIMLGDRPGEVEPDDADDIPQFADGGVVIPPGPPRWMEPEIDPLSSVPWPDSPYTAPQEFSSLPLASPPRFRPSLPPPVMASAARDQYQKLAAQGAPERGVLSTLFAPGGSGYRGGLPPQVAPYAVLGGGIRNVVSSLLPGNKKAAKYERDLAAAKGSAEIEAKDNAAKLDEARFREQMETERTRQESEASRQSLYDRQQSQIGLPPRVTYTLHKTDDGSFLQQSSDGTVKPVFQGSKLPPPARVKSVAEMNRDDAMAMLSAKSGKKVEELTAAERAQALREWEAATSAKPVGGKSQAGAGSGSASSNIKEYVDAVIRGEQSPKITSLYRDTLAVKAEFGRRGYNQAAAERDWTAINKHLSTLNGAQQERLRQAVSFTYDSIDVVENLYKEWMKKAPQFGFKALNRATLAAAKQAPGEAGAIATQLEAQINDLTSELGTVYKGGNSSTDESLRLASENLKSNWNQKTFERALATLRQNLRIRKNSILNSEPVGVSPNSPYLPSGGQGGKIKVDLPGGGAEYFDTEAQATKFRELIKKAGGK